MGPESHLELEVSYINLMCNLANLNYPHDHITSGTLEDIRHCPHITFGTVLNLEIFPCVHSLAPYRSDDTILL